jgi:hypothetical protein
VRGDTRQSGVREALEIAKQRVAEDGISWARAAHRVPSGPRTGGGDEDDLIGVGDRQAAKDQPIEAGEDRGVDADAERERHDRHDGDQRPLRERSRGIAEVLEEGVDHC